MPAVAIGGAAGEGNVVTRDRAGAGYGEIARRTPYYAITHSNFDPPWGLSFEE